MFEKMLIADRGANTVRIARSCKRLGVETVALHGERDQESPHVHACDEALQLDADEQGVYLSHDAILAAAKRAGAAAIHPGFGRRAADPALARAVTEAGLVFVGPTPDTLDRFADRLASRATARWAGIRVPFGSEGKVETAEEAAHEMDLLDGPCRLKPVNSHRSATGPIEDEEELSEAFAATSADREAGGIYVEREVRCPRRIDIQILRDSADGVIAVWERECSIRDDRGPLVLESPSPALSGFERGERVREAMCDAAMRIANEAGITGAATLRFLLDVENRFYFVGLTAGLDTFHESTELCTGLDLVEMQLRLAAGEPLPAEAHTAAPSGHALTVRLDAVPPKGNGATFPGEPLAEVRWPHVAPGKMRVETGVQAGCTPHPADGRRLASISTYAATRHRALLGLDAVLAESRLSPIATNAEQLREVFGHESFRAGQYDVTFVEQKLGAKP